MMVQFKVDKTSVVLMDPSSVGAEVWILMLLGDPRAGLVRDPKLQVCSLWWPQHDRDHHLAPLKIAMLGLRCTFWTKTF